MGLQIEWAIFSNAKQLFCVEQITILMLRIEENVALSMPRKIIRDLSKFYSNKSWSHDKIKHLIIDVINGVFKIVLNIMF